MIGMSFGPFVALLIVGLIAAVVLHFIVRYRMLAGVDGFLGKWVVGWIGAWVGSPVLGHWGPHIASQYYIPALIGAFCLAFLATIAVRVSMASVPRMRKAEGEVAVPSAQLEMRKAS